MSGNSVVRLLIKIALLSELALYGTTLAPTASFAQTGVQGGDASNDIISVKINGQLSTAARQALAELIEPMEITSLIESASKYAKSLDQICRESTCEDSDRRSVEVQPRSGGSSLLTGKVMRTTGSNWSGTIGTPRVPQEVRRDYTVFPRTEPFLNAAGVESGADLIAIPADKVKVAGKSSAGEEISISINKGEAALASIDRDLSIGNRSERHFRLNRALDASEIAKRLEIIESSSSITLERGTPKHGFELITFETSGAACTESHSNWPFNVGDLIKILRFNDIARVQLKLGPPRRSRILVVDTGVGRKLAQSSGFERLLYADLPELLSPTAVQKRFSDNPICPDANGNKYWNDVYGTGADADYSEDEKRCLDPGMDRYAVVSPHPRKDSSKQVYYPDHGSFVGSLASGGPDLNAKYEGIERHIGLTFFRAPTKSVDSALHVVNEYGNITRSIEYAEKIQADVINMSLKTRHEGPFDGFINKSSALLVAAAGNSSENLDLNSPDNRPASMAMKGMIVVAALQQDVDSPLWSKSAYSNSKVHIAAPGSVITSFDSNGERVCDSGTSAAAPLVAFTSAMVRSLTGAHREVVRSRVLAAADNNVKLVDKIEDGRRLNVEAAIDVFVDRVEVSGLDGVQLKRGWIEADEPDKLVVVCGGDGGPLNSSRGKIDLALLWSWWQTGNAKVAIRHQLESSDPFKRLQCDIPEGKFSFYDLELKRREQISWKDVSKMLPTPFRGVKQFVLGLK